MGLLEKIFGTYSERQLKKIYPIADAIEAIAPKYKAMSDSELRNMTDVLKGRLANGESLDDILVDAFATVREADERVLGKRPFYVQLVGGIILHQGRIAEMKTGEGKTLVATLPAYLNALAGNGVHIVTVNEYLAKRDSDEMGRVYGFLGLSTGLIHHDQAPLEKQSAYKADITYGTNNEFGFDYLRDNMAIYSSQLYQRGHAFAIVDEVDSILIDEARTPLIISGEGDEVSELYAKADALVRTMRKYVIKEADKKELMDDVDADYIVDEKAHSVNLTKSGIEKAEKFFDIENLSDIENATIAHHVNQAMRAHGVMKRDVDYIVKDDEVLIIDSFTGRIMYGRRYSESLHQAIEAKERVEIKRENKTLATISFQNYFRMYKKLSGMTGTALTEENEFREIYALDVVEVPTNKPMIRKDLTDAVYTTTAGKYRAIVEQIKACNEKGQPVLVGTVSIEKSEELSAILKKQGIKHTVLNAKYHEKEAEIVAQAGKLNAVTISTNMAGRGTDIMLGGNAEFLAKHEMRRREIPEQIINLAVGTSEDSVEEVVNARALFKELVAKYKEEIAPEAEKVRQAGGLYILGTERHKSRRIDNQLRGRAGRQGDPGASRFFLSLEDDLMRLFGGDRIMGMVKSLGIDEDTVIDQKILSGSIESAQKKIEDREFNFRKSVIEYDNVMNEQRRVIYSQRRDVMDGEDMSKTIKRMINDVIDTVVAENTSDEVRDDWNYDAIRSHFYGYLTADNDFRYTSDDFDKISAEDISNMLKERAEKLYSIKEELFGENIREVERVVLLRSVDENWVEHLEAMDQMRAGVFLQGYAQRNPLNEYKITGSDMFDEMIYSIKQSVTRRILTVMPKEQPTVRVQVLKEANGGRMNLAFEQGRTKAPEAPKAIPTVRAAAKVGRNDPCPCGSGKKYKKCCGANDNDAEN
ncbi:MAG: preprotein translocase subunit SecA [Clostridia bacterium]|nr:preprotein translocase subunit SecA [Clostridia bacterium]